ncbi:hypothetical protein [Bacterioplanoides sp.]|uniref:hypothetical protein n=1 Tax=Bacterioplanoides sp. TaxID=2066072 RepID=UPI003B00A84B
MATIRNFPFQTLKLFLLLTALLVALATASTPAQAKPSLVWQWQHPFSAQEQQVIRQWLTEVHNSMTDLYGELPFPIYLKLYRVDRHTDDDMGEPVPWARTRRQTNRQSLEFYIDTRYSLDDLRRDWTAPHEFSHLIFPYLGEKDAWLAEGFASYLQYQVMKKIGVIDGYTHQQRLIKQIQKAEKNYAISPALRSFRQSELPAFAEVAPVLRLYGDHPTMYWGGAVFFLQVDAQLQKKGGLQSVLKRYIKCCRTLSYQDHSEQTTQQLLDTLDRLSFSQIFSDTYQQFQSKAGFPEYRKFIRSFDQSSAN